MARKLWCFARGREGEWEAICLNYDIAVVGRTFPEVENLLQISVADYVESALKEAPEASGRLLRRRAPIYVILGYILAFIWHNLRQGGHGGKDDDRLEHSFQMPCPA